MGKAAPERYGRMLKGAARRQHDIVARLCSLWVSVRPGLTMQRGCRLELRAGSDPRRDGACVLKQEQAPGGCRGDRAARSVHSGLVSPTRAPSNGRRAENYA